MSRSLGGVETGELGMVKREPPSCFTLTVRVNHRSSERIAKGDTMREEPCNLNLLTTTLNTLLRYVNKRCHVVREAQSRCHEDELSRNELLERYLWQHRELIEDYVKDNPDHLPADTLAIVSDLAGTLYGTLYLEGCGSGTATFLHETGVYQALLPSQTFAARIPEGLLELRGALAPYQGRIVLIPPLSYMGHISPTVLAHVRAYLARQELASPTNSGAVLSKRVATWLSKHNEACAQGAQVPLEQLGPGFHRGVLAGLKQDQRQQLCSNHTFQLARESGQGERLLEAVRLDVDTFPVTLEEALAILDTDWLNDIALEMGDEALTFDCSRQQLIQWICKQIACRHDVLESALMWCFDEQFHLIGMLLDTNPLPLDGLDPALVQHLYPIVPYVFILHEGTTTLAWMPPEVSTLISREDYYTATEVRRRLGEVPAAARALTTMCGIVSVSDIYERYRRVSRKPLDRRHFEVALEELQTCDTREDYALWRHMGVDYAISVEIADESAVARVTREYFSEHVADPEATGLPTSPLVVGLTEQDESAFMSKVAQCEEELEHERLSLLARDRKDAPPDLDPSMLESRPIEALMKLQPLQALQAFLDAHVPDDQDDYEFADIFVRSVVVSAVLMAENYNETMDLIRLYHLQNCDGTGFSDTLGRLVTNAYNALPRWDLNGWSLEQCTERITGQRRFYNPDGTPRVIEASDPCPCGSGKPYIACCGHLRNCHE